MISSNEKDKDGDLCSSNREETREDSIDFIMDALNEIEKNEMQTPWVHIETRERYSI